MGRAKVVAIGMVLGSLLSAIWAASQLPSTWSLAERVSAWLWYMSGPFCWLTMGIPAPTIEPFVFACVSVGVLCIPTLVAHPIRPSSATAVITLLGFAAWFNASFFTVVWAVWGG
jgi:hypothetical protein